MRFLHVFGDNKIKTGKISRRPIIIINDKTTLINGEYIEKFPPGPTAPKPGPILLIVVATVLNAEIKSGASKLTIKVAVHRSEIAESRAQEGSTAQESQNLT